MRRVKPARTRRRKWLRRLLIGFGVVVLLLAGTVGGGYLWVHHQLDSVPRFKAAQTVSLAKPAPPGKPQNILLVGSDSRSFIGNNQQLANELGNPSVQSGQRSDVIIIVRLVPATDTVEMLSIPRDTIVPIASTGGSDRINTAFNYGPNQLIKTIQRDFGIPINHVIVANFPGFTSIVQALGGIYLDFPDPATDAYTGLRIRNTGCQLVSGVQSLQFVRSRHYYYYPSHHIGAYEGNGLFVGGVYDGMSDWSRIRRQQAFFHAVIDRVHAEDTNLLAMTRLLSATVKDVIVDKGLTTTEMLSLAWHYRHFGSGSLRTLVLPTSEGWVAGQYGIGPAVPQAHQVVSDFLKFGTPVKAASHPSTTSPTSASTATTVPGATTVPTTTSPANSIVSDTPQTLPEPWNAVPCAP